ncbi:hypothetical protein [Tissierella sp.]|uniref:hypothetical protein n=1 Tax=Tissierella sp. TaxID=41274 RepID=UPI0028ABC984|nr:hypothetical protein [Tissierella sp.]
MNNEKLTLQFIKTLTDKTLKNEISWEYLDLEDKHQLAYNLDLADEHPFTPHEYIYAFNRDESFSFTSDDQNINVVIYCSSDDDYPTLKIVPFTFRNILTVDESVYLSALVELLNAIKKQFPNPYDFMDTFIKN